MISKNTVKFIKSLQQKKFRKQENAFFVEGAKNVTELLHSDFEVTHLLYTDKYYETHPDLINDFSGNLYHVNSRILESAGVFKTNEEALAVAMIKDNRGFRANKGELVLALDDVRDPGNLGTIIRIADWYGIRKLVFSEQTADFYNPKVLQASMGSFTRVDFFYTELKSFLADQALNVYGAFLEGDNIHKAPLEAEGIIVVGNESKGISAGLAPFISHKITIPRFGDAESLNVAIATAVICDNFKRNF